MFVFIKLFPKSDFVHLFCGKGIKLVPLLFVLESNCARNRSRKFHCFNVELEEMLTYSCDLAL
jgi:hypothetical protein